MHARNLLVTGLSWVKFIFEILIVLLFGQGLQCLPLIHMYLYPYFLGGKKNVGISC